MTARRRSTNTSHFQVQIMILFLKNNLKNNLDIGIVGSYEHENFQFEIHIILQAMET
jgi:hypothetical protein